MPDRLIAERLMFQSHQLFLEHRNREVEQSIELHRKIADTLDRYQVTDETPEEAKAAFRLCGKN